MSVSNIPKMKELGMSESTIKKTVKNRWISFKKRRTRKKYVNRLGKIQVYIRSDEVKCILKFSKDSKKLIENK